MSLQLEFKPAPPAHCFFEEIDDTVLVLHPTKPVWIELNATGLELFHKADGQTTIREIAAKVAQKFGVQATLVEGDALRFFQNLEQTGFLDTGQRYAAGEDQLRLHLFFHLHQACNLTCPHCYTQSDSSYHWKPAPDDVIRVLRECAAHSCTTLTLSGGEPLLYPDLDRILNEIGPLLKIRLLTNGTLLTPSGVDLIVKTCDSIQISLDGSTPALHDAIRGPGVFQSVQDGIRVLQDAGFGDKIVLCTTVTNQNLHDILAIIEFAEQHEIPLLRFLPLMLQGRAAQLQKEIEPSDEDLIKLYEQILPFITPPLGKTEVSGYLSGLLLRPLPGPDRDQWCPVGRTIVMNFGGDIAPCVLMSDKKWQIGNLFRDSLKSIMDKGVLQQLRKTIRQRREIIPRCKECSWKNFCQAGCAGIALQQKSTFRDVDRFCEYRQQLYPRLFRQLLQQKRQILQQREQQSRNRTVILPTSEANHEKQQL